MSFLLWIVFGLIVGFIASNVVGSGGGLLTDIILGVIGAVIGGWLFQQFGMRGVTGFNLWSGLVAVIGAIVVLLIFRLVRRA